MDTEPATPWQTVAVFPHCDAKILHSPGSCTACDLYPDWQQLREYQGIAFTDYDDEHVEAAGLVPCPSSYHRTPQVRDRWPWNRASAL